MPSLATIRSGCPSTPSWPRLLRRLHALPAQGWRRTVIDIPQRRHPHVRSVDETVTLRGDAGPMRQLALDGLGRSELTRLISHHVDASARELRIR
jgi:hypothetical protein